MPALKTTANNIRTFMPLLSIPQLRSVASMDFGCGNIGAFRNTVRISAGEGIRALCTAPINETEPDIASLFSRSSNNALSTRIVALDDIPEIMGTPELRGELDAAFSAHAQETAGRKMNIPLLEKENARFLRNAYDVFLRGSRFGQRKRAMGKFYEEQGWWLKPYSAFKTMERLFSPAPMEKWDMDYTDLSGKIARAFLRSSEAKYLRGFFEFSQFEIDRQVRDALKYAHNMGIEEIELLMGVGVSRISAEAFLMGDIYDRFRQIGCLPEPENGYPLQLWGFPAERTGSTTALEFKVKSLRHMRELGFDRISLDHAAGLLGGYFTFPVYDPDMLKKGQFRILNALDPHDEKLAIDDCRWDCYGMDPNDHANTVLRSILEQVPGMKLSAETVGDKKRREAAESAIGIAIENGHDITLMEPLPWWDADKVPALSDYSAQDRLSLTHDMPALTALLTGRVGDHEYPWISGNSVSGLLRRFGILSPQVNRPIDISELTPEFMYEVMKRIVCGSSAGTVSLPIATLFTMKECFLDGGKWMCINIQPGTPGVVDETVNKVGNFLQRMPKIENLRDLEPKIRVLASREPEYFDPPSTLAAVNPDARFKAEIREAGRSVAYQAANGKWTVWRPEYGKKPLWELAFSYSGGEIPDGHEGKAWAKYYIGQLGFSEHKKYLFIDLSDNTKPLSFSGWELVGGSISIGLSPSCNRHHFVVLEK